MKKANTATEGDATRFRVAAGPCQSPSSILGIGGYNNGKAGGVATTINLITYGGNCGRASFTVSYMQDAGVWQGLLLVTNAQGNGQKWRHGKRRPNGEDAIRRAEHYIEGKPIPDDPFAEPLTPEQEATLAADWDMTALDGFTDEDHAAAMPDPVTLKFEPKREPANG